MKELVALAKARPGAINHSSAGVGTFTFLAAEMFKRQAAVNMLHVPYRAGGEALTAVISGETSVYFSPAAGALPQVKQGRLRPLAVTSSKRITLMPELPTVAESGVPGYEVTAWYGVSAPAKTPPAVVERLNSEMLRALKLPDVREQLKSQGADPVGSTPAQYSAFMQNEISKWAKVIAAAGIKGE